MTASVAQTQARVRRPAAIAAKPAAAQPVARGLTVPSAISADLLRPASDKVSALSLGMVALVAAFVIWSALAIVDETTRGEGRVIPATKIQVVQNLEGGIVRELRVREGMLVKAGDILLRIDPTRADSSLGETRERILGFRVMIHRLEAEVEQKPLVIPEDLRKLAPGLVRRQEQAYDARMGELKAALDTLELQAQQKAQEIVELEARVESQKRSLQIAQSELKILKPLYKQGAISHTDLLAAERRYNEAEGLLDAARLALPRIRAQKLEMERRRAEKRAAHRSDVLKQLTDARVQLSALAEQNRGAADTVARTIVRSPASGIVKTVHVTTIGQIVKPGSDIVEIVPSGDTLLIEARIRPSDIAFLRPGQPATVKLTAYDFALYGGLDGRLEQIGADSITNERGETYYLIRVRTVSSKLRHGGADLPIIPGMVAQVDIKTGQKSVLAYLTKPLTRMKQDALKER